ncbi:hypothetical protein M0802_013618 [Mischocyttarus mexicanus]|nr:hypothetical protein M0802_013618 [Mischocyttarus mexicanus]
MRSTSRIVAKRARHSGNRREIKVPEVIIYYNKNMGDVDLVTILVVAQNSKCKVQKCVVKAESSDSDVFMPVAKLIRHMIVNDSSEEEDTTEQPWIWRKGENTPIVWKYSGHHGIKAPVLNNLSDNPKILDLFFITFDKKFWKSLVTETNRFADQTIHDERKKRCVDDI